MTVLIQLVDTAYPIGEAAPGDYLAFYDVDALDGRGLISGTRDASKALRFADHGEAFEFWKQQSTVLPLRPDGKPNRPLTAWTITLVEVAE